MLKAILVDDEQPALDILNIMLEKTGQVTVIKSFLSSADALLCIKSIRPDVAFLDIEMPEITGLQLAEKILDIDSHIEIVFVTAYDKYALEAFRVNALDYILKPISLDNVKQSVLRIIKRKKPVSNLLTDILEARIYCFGKLSVYGPISNQTIKWRTSKAEELFAYMLQNLEKEVSKWEICESLWPDCSTEKINIYLHTTIYKMKKVLNSANIDFDIKFKNGCYKMSLYKIYIDMVEFDSLLNSDIIITEHTIEKYRKAFSIYKNDYLEGNDYIWSLSKREEYSKRYLILGTSLVKYYMKRNEHAQAETILHKLLEKFPLNEDIHQMLLKLYFINKDRISFINHYESTQKLFKMELGIELSDSIKSLYNSTLYN